MVDAATQEFMRIVKCEAHEVLDIPPGRRWANKPKRTQIFKGGAVLTFGMHRGKCLSEVPRDYLEWLANQPRLLRVPGARAIEELKEKIRQFIA